MFWSVSENSVLKNYFNKIINRLVIVIFLLLLSAQIMAIQYRILNEKLLQVGTVEEFSEDSAMVSYMLSGNLGAHAESISPASFDHCDSKEYQCEMTIWKLLIAVQKDYSLPERFILASSLLTGQPLYLVKQNLRHRNRLRMFRFVNSAGNEHWDIIIFVRGGVRRLLNTAITGIIILVNGELSNIVIPPGDWTEVKIACIEKLKLLNPRESNEAENISVYDQKPPPPPPPSPPAYINIQEENIAESAFQ